MLDLVIRGATVIDGTGAPGRVADVAVAEGRIAEVGRVTDTGRADLDGDGLLVLPGIVDPHTHYDAQLLWDPTASPSNRHGVTSVVGGNCGFSLAPLRPGDADYLRRMMASVEGMPLHALEAGLDGEWEGFADYLDRLDGRMAVNAGFMVGHCALRRYVMGADAVGHEADPDQVAAMVSLLHAGLDAGGLGLSTTLSPAHRDGDGEPVASRWATTGELLALCGAVGSHDGAVLEAALEGGINRFSDDEIDLMARMSAAAGRSLNWNLLTVDAGPAGRDRVDHQLAAADAVAGRGGSLVALTMPTNVPMTARFAAPGALALIPGWGEVLRLPVAERKAQLADPAVRAALAVAADDDAIGPLRRVTEWDTYLVGDTFSPANEGLAGRTVGSIARERGQSPFDTLVDVALADDFRTVLWPMPTDDDATWELRARVWTDPRVVLGGSDAGAHLDRMFGAHYPTRFLADCLRGQRLLPVESAVRLLTDVPAQLFGLRRRGRVAPGWHADLAVVDPAVVDAAPVRLAHDLPAGAAHFTADAVGVRRVYVGGVATIVDDEPTGALPGCILRSARDTTTGDREA